MSSDYLTNPLLFVLDVIFNLFLLAVVLRFLFQWLRVDFYNPLSQTIVKMTSPLVNPLRKVIPGLAGLDMASLLLAILIAALKAFLFIQFRGQTAGISSIIVMALYEVISLTLNIFLFSIFILVILSWVAPGQRNPIISVLYQLTAPILLPLRRIIPDLGGIDLSPMVAIVAIQVAKMLILPPLAHLV